MSSTVVEAKDIYINAQDKMILDCNKKADTLESNNTQLQTTIAKINEEKDKKAIKQLAEQEAIFLAKEKILNARISDLEKTANSYHITREKLIKENKEICDDCNSLASQLSEMRSQEASIVNKLSILHENLRDLKPDYLAYQTKCNKEEGLSVAFNECEIASFKKGEVEALESEIETNRMRLTQVSEQLLLLNQSFSVKSKLPL